MFNELNRLNAGAVVFIVLYYITLSCFDVGGVLTFFGGGFNIGQKESRNGKMEIFSNYIITWDFKN